MSISNSTTRCEQESHSGSANYALGCTSYCRRTSTYVLKVWITWTASTFSSNHNHFFGLREHILEDGIPAFPFRIVENGRAVKEVEIRRIVIRLRRQSNEIC
jgi:hypothetical protein